MTQSSDTSSTRARPRPAADFFVTTRWTVVLSAVHRLRKRDGELLREEIAQTLNDPAQVAEELRSLQAALAS